MEFWQRMSFGEKKTDYQHPLKRRKKKEEEEKKETYFQDL